MTLRIPLRYADGMSTRQIAVRLPLEQLHVIDDLVARGVFDSRADAVRAGIDAIHQADQRRQIDDAVINGYRHVPPTAPEQAAALASLRDAIADEPW
jgi:Arc/MetJ-type ribon-helix-helix transcriptional regulator